MPTRSGSIHVATTARNYKGKTYHTHLLRRTFREDGKVKHETLGNISHLPEPLIDLIRRSLKGEQFLPVGDSFEIRRSLPHGHVQAVLSCVRRLDLENIIASQPSRFRCLTTAMVVQRILDPASKLATARELCAETAASTLGQELHVQDLDEDDLYEAMDWVLERQDQIEAKLARRHLQDGSLILCDVLLDQLFQGSAERFGADGAQFAQLLDREDRFLQLRQRRPHSLDRSVRPWARRPTALG